MPPSQLPLTLYGRGIVKTKSGHLRYTSPKSVRGQYVHREIVYRQIDETPYSIRLLLPWPYEIHHMDYNKEHNGDGNLLLLPEAFHAKLTADRARDDGGRFGRKFMPRWNRDNAPAWLFEKEDQGVPF